MEYVIGIGIVLFIAYKFMVRSNNREMDTGRDYLAKVDATEFLARPANSLHTSEEIAALNYLALRPWRDTRGHFARLLNMFRGQSQIEDHEVKEVTKLLLDDMGCSQMFVMLCDMAPLPSQLFVIAPKQFSKWTNDHKKELEEAPEMSVGYFMNFSSRAAARAFFEVSRSRRP